VQAISSLLVWLLLTLCVSPAAAQTPAYTLSSSNGLVTLRATDAPLAEIFDSLVAKGLVELRGMDKLTTVVSIDMQGRSIDAVVSALLADYNVVITTPKPAPGRPGPLARVVVHSLRDGAAAKGPVSIFELRTLRSADLESELPDPVDPDDDPDARAEAEEAAKERAEEEADAIAELAEREKAGAFDAKVPLDDLSELIEADNPRIRARAYTALNARDAQDALLLLLKGLEDESPTVRYHVVDLVGRRADPASLEHVGAILAEHEDNAARYSALMVIAARADRSSVSIVEGVATDSDPIIRAAAVTFLREMAKRAFAPPPAPQKPPQIERN
jgi:hypothetical protein